jgi:TRAP-type C4-dicarboxylate transport system permease small subunit
MGISMGYAYAAIFVGAVLIGIFSLESILRKEDEGNVGSQ